MESSQTELTASTSSIEDETGIKEEQPPTKISTGNKSTKTTNFLIVNANALAVRFSLACNENVFDQSLNQNYYSDVIARELADNKRRRSRQVWKNLFVLSACVLCVLSAYDMVRYVESSFKMLDGIGTIALAANYAVAVPCLLLLPSLLVRRIGLTWTLVITMYCFVPFFVAHFYPSYFTLVPAAVFMGLGSGIMETTANCAVTELALAYASLHNLKPGQVLNNFFSAFVMIVLTSRIWGNTASAFLFKSTTFVDSEKARFCGVEFCSTDPRQIHSSNHSANHTIEPYGEPDGAARNATFAMYGSGAAVIFVAGLGVAIFLRHIPRRRNSLSNWTVSQHLAASLDLMKRRRMLYLIPSTVCLGMMEAFLSGDYTQAFVTCSLGLNSVGPVIICYGLTAAATSAISGLLSNLTGRFAVFLSAFGLNIGLLVVMLLWTPNPGYITVYYAIAGGWGAADALWRTQLFALYGDIFKRRMEAAFSNLEVWESIGLMLGYAGHDLLCTRTKIWIVMFLLICGFIGCSSVEVGEIQRNRRTNKLSKELS